MDNRDERSAIEKLFICRDETRLRAGWRLLIHGFLTLFFIMFFGAIVASFLLILVGPDSPLITEGDRLVSLLISLPAFTLSTYIARRFIDRRTFRSLGFELDRRAVPDLIVGFLIAAFMIMSIFILEWAMGYVEITGFAWETASSTEVLLLLLGNLVIFFAAAYQEELLSRGYQLQNLVEGLNLPWGLILSSIMFALLHLLNPFTSAISIIGLILAGLFLAFGWIRTHQLWLPIGLHSGWNFFEGTVFGFRVSGVDTPSLIQITTSGPELITGGPFGPEAGLVALLAMILGAILVWLYTQNRLPTTSEEPSDDVTPGLEN
ncbi:MAG: CPBP family intramembrane metalloprotease [Anaerolineales bacterium]|nr:CPBP family intramembrane metalloprotease [Anaerolineales bacterium]